MKALNNNAHPLESLLKQHCPNGVEFKELGELGEFYGGLSGKTKKDFEKGNAKYISYKNIFTNLAVSFDYNDFVTIQPNEKHHILKLGDVLFTGSSETQSECGISSVVTKQPQESIYLNSFCFGFRFYNENLFLPDFTKYLFRDETTRQQIIKTANGTTRFNVSKKLMAKVKIPIPPLEIQQKIVDILDAFTELQAELEAELEARLKQYHYYRNKLLSHDELENRTAKSRNDSDPTPIVPYVRLGEVCEKISNIKWKEMQNQTFKYIDLTSVDRENCQITQTQTITKENAPSRAQQIVQTDDVICGTTRPTLQRYCYITKQYDGQICSTGFCVLRANKTQILPKWIFFNLKTNNFLKHIERFQQGASYPSIADADLKKFQIPLPPLAVQNEIVELLDKFDTLTNDLTSGIPAEIEARKKQYEYYRERLLSFIAKD
ncbi:TPA: restriction endonuclease subunit S [Campylobacter upsaliensis]|nr:restriction endonuclease subunit S [Campylobacter upsaliensis]